MAICDGIDWVGFVDWNVRDFHGYDTHRGATYNAYLVRDEKTALIDTVKGPYAKNLLTRVGELAGLDKVDYVVCNHAEPDHSGSLPAVMAALPHATLLCNKKCSQTLGRYYDTSGWRIQIVASGDSVSLGKRTLQFIDTPMVHWPESMFTYVPEEKLLFSMDAFGQHYATSQRFDDEADLDTVMAEAKSYYANIVMPYGKRVVLTLKQAGELELEIIAPSHGLIWRSHMDRILEAYADWAVCKPVAKVLVMYDSMWDSTGRMARAIYDGAAQSGVEVQLLHVRKTSLTRIATEALDAACIAFGSSTLNGEMMPQAAAVLTYLKGLKPVGKAALAFGSYGWAKQGPAAVEEMLKAMKWEILREPVLSQYAPGEAVLADCRSAGKLLADKARELAEAVQ